MAICNEAYYLTLTQHSAPLGPNSGQIQEHHFVVRSQARAPAVSWSLMWAWRSVALHWAAWLKPLGSCCNDLYRGHFVRQDASTSCTVQVPWEAKLNCAPFQTSWVHTQLISWALCSYYFTTVANVLWDRWFPSIGTMPWNAQLKHVG